MAAATATARRLEPSRPAALASRERSSALRGFFFLRTTRLEVTCFLSSSEQGARLSCEALRDTALEVMSTKLPGSLAASLVLARCGGRPAVRGSRAGGEGSGVMEEAPS